MALNPSVRLVSPVCVFCCRLQAVQGSSRAARACYHYALQLAGSPWVAWGSCAVPGAALQLSVVVLLCR